MTLMAPQRRTHERLLSAFQIHEAKGPRGRAGLGYGWGLGVGRFVPHISTAPACEARVAPRHHAAPRASSGER